MLEAGNSFFNQPPKKYKNNYDGAFLEYFKKFTYNIDPKIATKKYFLKRFIDIFLNECFETLMHKNLFIYKFIFNYSDDEIIKKLKYFGLNDSNYHKNIIKATKQFESITFNRILN